MTQTTDGPDETTAASSRDWVKAAVWIGVIVLIVVAALILLVNAGLCGCLTRPA
jgi:hypothetical protein